MTYYTEHAPGRIVKVEGHEYLYFGGTSYLGMQTDMEFRDIILHCTKKYGSSHGASRISNLRLTIYQQAENQLAAWVGSEAALTMSSGFLAGQLLAYLFGGTPYKPFYAPGTHPAVILGANQPFGTLADLELAIREALSKNPEISPVLFVDSIDLAGNAYPGFELLRRLPLSKVIVVADDSHGLGILGDQGGGLYTMLLELNPKELLVCCSLGKALGVQGGAIFGQADRLREIWETPFFSGASPAPPGHMAAFMSASMALYNSKRKQLQKNMGLFEVSCQNMNHFRTLPHFPVFGFNNPELTSFLVSRGILATDFAYAASSQDSFNGRLVLSAHHREEDILLLSEALLAFPGDIVL